MPEQASFSFEPDAVAGAENPSEIATRLIWLVLAFIREREVSFVHYFGIFGRTERTFKRDVAKLRELGGRYGFTLTRQRVKKVRLVRFDGDGRVRADDAAGDAASAEAVRALSDAFGDIVAASLRGVAAVDGTALDRFLRVAAPKLVSDSATAATYRAVREAWRARARLRFGYPARGDKRIVERVVEPHLTTYFGGRYYLVGFDVRPRGGGWRQFALDRIHAPIARAGTFRTRTVPDEYRGEDAIGLFKTGPATNVVVEFSAAIAEAVLARRWQRAERVERRADGSARLTLEVRDAGEAVRWAFSFGTEARVVAPATAVRLARETAATLLRAYDDAERGDAPAAYASVS